MRTMLQSDKRRTTNDGRRKSILFRPPSFAFCLGLALIVVILLTAACGGNADNLARVPAAVVTSAASGEPADTSATPSALAWSAPAPVAGPTTTPTVAAPEGTASPVFLAGAYWSGWAGTDCASYTERPVAFCRAMKDAEIAGPDEISTSLTAITPYNQELIWSGIPGESRVLTVTWSSFIDRNPAESAYDPKNGFRAGKSMVSAQDIFVTVVPELREFCLIEGPFEDRPLRIEQLLGLAPNSGKDGQGKARAFVELWVSPQDLFRPAPDPEITDHEAGLGFPASGRFLTVSEDHIKWFKEFKSISYEETGLPWTRLGYTYDWGNPDSEVGLSEFVIKEGANVKVFSIASTDEYCP